MPKATPVIRVESKLLLPAKPEKGSSWAFLMIPKSASDQLPRRGRTSIAGTLEGHPFKVTLDPDGQLGHWMKVDAELLEATGAKAGDLLALEFSPLKPEPEPEMPEDFEAELSKNPRAGEVWDATTTLARVDWIHWMVSAKQAATRKKRIAGACDMLASGKKRVCCFDPSGYYSKAFAAPEAAD